MDKRKRRFFRRVKRNLIAGTRQEKRVFLEGLSKSIDDYLEFRPRASEQEMEGSLGTPESLAEDFIATLDRGVVRSVVRRKKTAIWILIGVLCVFVAAVLTLGTIYTVEVYKYAHGSVTVTEAMEGEYVPPTGEHVRNY